MTRTEAYIILFVAGIMLAAAIMLMMTVSNRQNTQDRQIADLRLEDALIREKINKHTLTVNPQKAYMDINIFSNDAVKHWREKGK